MADADRAPGAPVWPQAGRLAACELAIDPLADRVAGGAIGISHAWAAVTAVPRP